jgi:UDP-N-acetylmuramoylalanine--D-glutamate ligase
MTTSHTPWQLPGMKVTVVGAARTGRAAARFLASRGAVVTLVDRSPERAFPDLREELGPLGVRLEFGPHTEESFLGADGIVLSPGVPTELEQLQEARARGIRIVAEIELACWFLDAPILAITGTNGKTTTTTLVGMALERWGRRVFVGGNIGNPLINALEILPPPELAVVEVSSFQLEAIHDFRPRVAALLNLTEDHLDRHPTFEAYRRAKGRIFLRQGPGDVAVVNLDDPEVLRALPPSPAMEVWGFTLRTMEPAQAVWKDGEIHLRLPGGGPRIACASSSVGGPHGAQNLMAACLSVMAVGCPPEPFQAALRAFSGLEHRMEPVGEIRGVRFINDSKATNVGAVIPAIEACAQPVILIAGGKYKGIDFTPLRDPVLRKARAVVLLGEAAGQLAHALQGTVPLRQVQDMEGALAAAMQMAKPGDVILLSPACSSFDQYKDYEARGRHFKELFRRMAMGLAPR